MAPHSVCIGSATDPLGVPRCEVQKIRRWQTAIWTKPDVELDLCDLAKLRNATMSH